MVDLSLLADCSQVRQGTYIVDLRGTENSAAKAAAIIKDPRNLIHLMHEYDCKNATIVYSDGDRAVKLERTLAELSFLTSDVFDPDKRTDIIAMNKRHHECREQVERLLGLNDA